MKLKFSTPNILIATTVCIYIISVIWWFWLQSLTSSNSVAHYLFNIPMGLSPLIVGGALIVFSFSQFSSVSLKRYPLYFGLYLFLWGTATIGTVYYNFILKIEDPFPSVLDFSYVSSQACLLIAVIGYLLFIRQWKYVKETGQKILFFATAPIIQLILYWAVMQALNKEPFPEVEWQYVSSMFSLVLNIIVFIALYIFAFILFFKKVGKEDVQLGWYLIVGTTVQNITDYYFIFLIARNEFHIGHIVDLMFISVYMCMSLVGVKIYKRMLAHN